MILNSPIVSHFSYKKVGLLLFSMIFEACVNSDPKTLLIKTVSAVRIVYTLFTHEVTPPSANSKKKQQKNTRLLFRLYSQPV